MHTELIFMCSFVFLSASRKRYKLVRPLHVSRLSTNATRNILYSYQYLAAS